MAIQEEAEISRECEFFHLLLDEKKIFVLDLSRESFIWPHFVPEIQNLNVSMQILKKQIRSS